jgi:tetratricopeptide (TPR) repeat protein
MKNLHLRQSASAGGAAALMCLTIGAQQAYAAATGVSDHTPAARAAELRAQGLEHGYNLDYPQALAAFREAIATDPGDAAAYRLAAATVWITLLFQQGAVSVDDYLGQALASVPRKPPPADAAEAFHTFIDRATAIADQRIRENPGSADARFQAGAAAGFRASYLGTIEGRVLGGVGAARRAYDEHSRCMELDPSRKDAGLILGMYRYAIAELSFTKRLLARLAGFDADRASGLRLVEEASRYPSDVQTNARFTLILLYNREGRHADALRVIRQLQQLYPRNRLLWLEAGKTALRAAQPADALAALDEGLARFSTDPRPRSFGEEARWRYYRGAALTALRETDRAHAELEAALAKEGPAWVRGRTHVELGKLADLDASRPRAIEEYRLAIQDCRADRDASCVADARRLLSAGYR